MSYIIDLLKHFTDFVNGGGYWRIFWMMTIESTSIPIILPAELVLIAAGYAVEAGERDVSCVILIATIGSVVGSFINYYIASLLGRRLLYRYGKYFFISHNRMQMLEAAFVKHAAVVTFSGRIMPFIKHVVSIPAGMCNMNKMQFLCWTAMGSGLLSTVMVLIGAYFGSNSDNLEKYKLHIAVSALFVACMIMLVYYWYNKYFLKILSKHLHLERAAKRSD